LRWYKEWGQVGSDSGIVSHAIHLNGTVEATGEMFMAEAKRIGILTGGGDAPGLNAVIRAVTISGGQVGHEIVGFKYGWKGVLEKQYRMLTEDDVCNIHMEGGTILHSSRINPNKLPNGIETARKNLEDLDIYALIVAGGEDTLGVANKLSQSGVRVLGLPKTIDNDVNGTDYTFGFDTAINRVTSFLEILRTTTKSHNRVMVAEIMGRHAGWMTVSGGMAGGAHMIIIPEFDVSLEEICAMVRRRYASDKKYAVIAVSEGAHISEIAHDVEHSSQLDDFGHVQLGTGTGVADALAIAIERETGFESRSIVFGHLQRGGSPTAFDRNLGTRLGVHVIHMIRDCKFGMMAALKSGVMGEVPLEEAVSELKLVNPRVYNTAKIFFS
jgi:ATP-dependent phosphofructokinase / diphosphate-dependent phosphofructokinase